MGFGSYDESEQENQHSYEEVDEDEAVSINKKDHEGEVNFSSEASSDELLEQLHDIKEANE